LNSLVIGIFAIFPLYLGYRFYGSFIDRKLIGPIDDLPTPAVTEEDGVDFTPARPSMLLGHHFSFIAAAGLIASTGGITAIWPVFGAANQLVAALALVVISSFLIGVNRPGRYTVIPAIFMLFTAMGALLYKSFYFFNKGGSLGIVLGSVSIVLVALAVYISFEANDVLFRLKSDKKLIANCHPGWINK